MFVVSEVVDGSVSSFDEDKGAVAALLLLLMMLMLFVGGVAAAAICCWDFSLVIETIVDGAFVSAG